MQQILEEGRKKSFERDVKYYKKVAKERRGKDAESYLRVADRIQKSVDRSENIIKNPTLPTKKELKVLKIVCENLLDDVKIDKDSVTLVYRDSSLVVGKGKLYFGRVSARIHMHKSVWGHHIGIGFTSKDRKDFRTVHVGKIYDKACCNSKCFGNMPPTAGFIRAGKISGMIIILNTFLTSYNAEYIGVAKSLLTSALAKPTPAIKKIAKIQTRTVTHKRKYTKALPITAKKATKKITRRGTRP